MTYPGSVLRLTLAETLWEFASSLATPHLKRKWGEGERRGSQMLSPSRQPFLSTRCWGCGEGTHPRDLLLLQVSELKVGTKRLCIPHADQSSTDTPAGEWRDFIWRPPLGTAGSLALPPSFWEAAAYCFRGNNNRARLSMSDASCMPLGDPGKIHSSLGKCSLDHPFLPQHNLRGASTGKFHSWRPYLITFSRLLMFS